MTRRSTTARADEEFDVAVAARNRRRKHLDVGASERRHERRDVVADFLVHHGVANDAALGMLSRRFEVRFYQCQQMHRPGACLPIRGCRSPPWKPPSGGRAAMDAAGHARHRLKTPDWRRWRAIPR